jgi:phospholipid-binding lipoprotein MlaA
LLALLAMLATPVLASPRAPGPNPLADDADVTAPDSFPDPLEPMNRVTFRMNLGLDRWIMTPVARAYAWAVPAPARRGIRRALANLDSPAVFVNDVLQLNPLDAGVTLGRFTLNTTVGLLGIFDPANALGLPPHQADFGQTLALAGLPSGPYLILPIAGPTTARDATGYLVDFLFRPITYVLTPGAQIVWTSISEGSRGLASRDVNAEVLAALEASSLDFYAVLRNAFYQDRTARIAARRTRPRWPALAGARHQ